MSKLLIGLSLVAALGESFTIEERHHNALMIADPEECIHEKCPNQWDACQKDSKCPTTLQSCEKKCGSGKTCWELCLSKAGDQPAIDVAKCAAANHCLGHPQPEPEVKVELATSTALMIADPEQCIHEKCPNQWDACQKDSKCPSTLQSCEKKCGSGKTCWQLCLAKAGDQPAIDVAKCAAANNCLGMQAEVETSSEVSTALMVADPQQCIQEKCPKEYQECQKDSKCEPALQSCEKKCGTKQSCWEFCLPGKHSQAAIDVAKCAAKNNCLSMEAFLPQFEKCMAKSCNVPFAECIDDSMCRFFLRQCRNPEGMWNFDFECLVEKSAYSPKLQNFFSCGGHNKCI